MVIETGGDPNNWVTSILVTKHLIQAGIQGIKSVTVRNQQVMISKDKKYLTYGGRHPDWMKAKQRRN